MNAHAQLPPNTPSNHLTFPAPSGMASGKGPIHDSGKLPQLQPTPVSKNPSQSLSHDAARVAIENTPLPGNIWKPGTTKAGVQSLVASGLVSAPSSIVELARGLKNNVDLIYEYCATQLDFLPIQGLQKGALGAIIDQRGGSFDLADTMVQLLRQAGYSANYLYGECRISLADATAWLGTTTLIVARDLLNAGGIPAVVTNVAGTDFLDYSLCYVKVNIGGTWYVFDPSRKTYTTTTGINLATAMSYNQTTFINSAQTGATVNTDFVQNMNRANVRSNMATMTNNLVNWIKTNNHGATVDEIIGGKTINAPAFGPRNTVLGYEKPGSTPVEWTGIPNTYKHAFRVIYDSPNIDVTFFSADIYAKRMTLFFNASHQAELRIDGTLIATSSAQLVGSWNSVGLIATHPYGGTWADQGQWFRAYADYYYNIANAWGNCGPRMKEIQTSKYFENAAGGGAANSEPVLGQLLGAMFHALNTEGQRAHDIKDRMSQCISVFHHQCGLSGDIGVPLFDIGLVGFNTVASDGNNNRLYAARLPIHGVGFEASALQEMTGPLGVCASTIVDQASQAGLKIYNAKTSNWLGTVKPALTGYDAGTISYFESNYINNGWRICMPSDGAQVLGLFTGYGVFLLTPTTFAPGAIGIIGGAKGSFGQAAKSKDPDKAPLDGLKTGPGAIKYQDGNFSWAHNDLSLGSQGEPYGLSFTRYYQAANAIVDGPLGRGWSHSFNISVRAGSGSMSGLAKNSPIAGAAAIVEMFVANDLLSDTTQPHNKFVIALLANKWLTEQLVDNIVTIGSATNGAQFIKMPNGTYENPFKVAGTLVKNGDGTYKYTTSKQVVYNFNLDGTINTIVYPFGVTWTFAYTSGKLTSVTNGLGRTLTFSYTGTRLTSISDGTGRSVSFTVNPTTGVLTSVTDPNSKNWTYAYDASNRLTQVFYPANPTQAIFTNTFDSIGQVKERRDAYNNLTSYHYAGYRTEIVDPNNKSAIMYLNALGDITKSVNQVGKVTTQTFDGRGRLKSVAQPEGNSKTFTYDSKDNVLTITNIAKAGSGLANIVNTFTYNATYNKVATAKDGKNQTTTFTYDSATGNLLTIQRPAVGGKVPKTTNKWNSRGQLLSSIDPTGIQSQFIYDVTTERLLSQIANTNWRCTVGGTATAGNILTINVNDIGLSGGTKAISYTVVAGNTLAQIATGLNNAINADTQLASLGIVAYVDATVISISTSPGNATTFTGTTSGGATGTLTLVTGLNLTLSFGHNSRGDVTSVTDARSNTTTLSYDLLRRRTQVTAPAPFSYLTKFTFDDNGNTTKVEKQTNIVATPWQTVNMTYSFDNLLLSKLDPSNDSVSYVYNNLRKVQQFTDPASRATVYAYDDVGRPSTVTDSSTNIALTRTYTDNGLIASIADARGNFTSYTYDGFDRSLRRTFPDTTFEEVQSYDLNSNSLVLRLRNASTITNTYDALDRVATKSPSSMAVVTFTYDLVGRILSASKPTVSGDSSTGTFSIGYDSAGRAMKETYPGSKVFTNVLDASGNVTKTTWADGYFVDRAYDELDRPTTVKLNGSATAAATYTWDALSRPSTITRKNNTSSAFVWEIDNDLSSVSHSFAGATLLGGTLTYSYGYNAAGEMSSQNISDSQYMWHPASAGTVAFGTADSLNRYASVAGASLGYDGNGNLTSSSGKTFGYNTEQQLTSFSDGVVSSSYNYDPFGRMVQETVGATTSRQYYVGSELMGDYSNTGAVQSRYVSGGLGEPLAKVTSGGVESYFHSDGMGSVIAITDSAGNVSSRYAYSPFGETNSALTGTKFGFRGGIYDTASAGYLGASGTSYLPSIGRSGQDSISLGVSVNPGNPATPGFPGQESNNAILDILQNGSQVNPYYQDAMAQQQSDAQRRAAEDALYKKYHEQDAMKKGGFGTGPRLTPEMIEFLRWLKKNRIGEAAHMAADMSEAIAAILDALTLTASLRKHFAEALLKNLKSGRGPRAQGPFSIIDWSGYPEHGVPIPEGPFIVLEKGLVEKMRYVWDRFKSSQGLGGGIEFPWHHIKPLKFGGDPKDLANLQQLPKGVHTEYTKFWATLLKDLNTYVGNSK